MSLSELLAAARLRRHRTSREEMRELLRLADQALADARVTAVSLDRRFLAAYDAARSLATMVLACAGYRATGSGQHAAVFEGLPLIMGEELAELASYLDACRLKRNVAEYRRAGSIMDRDVAELIEAADSMRENVLAWIREEHPELQP